MILFHSYVLGSLVQSPDRMVNIKEVYMDAVTVYRGKKEHKGSIYDIMLHQLMIYYLPILFSIVLDLFCSFLDGMIMH